MILVSGVYITLVMCTTAASIMISITVGLMYNHDGQRRMPRWARIILLDVLSACVCRKRQAGSNERNIGPQQSSDSDVSVSNKDRQPTTSDESLILLREHSSFLRQILVVVEDVKGDKDDTNDPILAEWQRGADILETISQRVILILLFMIPIVCLLIAPASSQNSMLPF